MTRDAADLVQRLIEDEAFRKSFYGNPSRAASRGFAAADVAALLSIPAPYFSEFARALPAQVPDPRTASWNAVRLVRRH